MERRGEERRGRRGRRGSREFVLCPRKKEENSAHMSITFMIEARSCSTICLSTGSELVDTERPRVTLLPVSAVTLDDLEESFFLLDRCLPAALLLADLGSR